MLENLLVYRSFFNKNTCKKLFEFFMNFLSEMNFLRLDEYFWFLKEFLGNFYYSL